MNFNELHLLLEGFKEKRELFIRQLLASRDGEGLSQELAAGLVDDAIKIYKDLKLRSILPLKYRDIDQIVDFSKLIEICDEYKDVKSKSQIEKEQKVNGAKIVYKDDKCLIYHITTYEASVLLGSGTKWCISSNNNRAHFDDYSKTNNIYFSINLENNRKYATLVSFDDKWITYNQEDEQVGMQEFLEVPASRAFRAPDINERLDKFIDGELIKNADGSYDVDGSVNLSNINFTKGRLPWKFNKVTENFSIDHCNLITLEGCPSSCMMFICSYNKLTSLEHAPKTVKGIICNNNKLTNLEHFPNHANDFLYSINISNNRLTTLKGANFPSKVHYFDCSHNLLTNLEGGPSEWVVRYQCVNNIHESKLISLKGAPKVCQQFICWGNSLKTFEYAPTCSTAEGIFEGEDNHINDEQTERVRLRNLGYQTVNI